MKHPKLVEKIIEILDNTDLHKYMVWEGASKDLHETRISYEIDEILGYDIPPIRKAELIAHMVEAETDIQVKYCVSGDVHFSIEKAIEEAKLECTVKHIRLTWEEKDEGHEQVEDYAVGITKEVEETIHWLLILKKIEVLE